MIIKRIPSGDEHTDQKWLVLEGSVPGVPAVTKRRAINVAALVSGQVTLDGERALLEADVTEYLARWNALQASLKTLG